MLYGPFPILRWQLFGGLPMMLLAGIMLLLLAVPAALRLRCSAQMCRVERALWPSKSAEMATATSRSRMKRGARLRAATRARPSRDTGAGCRGCPSGEER